MQILTSCIAVATLANAANQTSFDQPQARQDFKIPDQTGIVHFDTDEDGAHWVMGDTYKAKIARDGFTYIPFLGSDAPRNYPVTMQLTRASAGDMGLRLASRATVSRTGDRFVIDRGPVQVIYDVAAEGVEQTFQFEEGLSGDLELELAMTGEMPVQPDGRGFRWANSLGGIRYGEATALDQAGATLAINSRLEVPTDGTNGTVSLVHHVPADFVREASGAVLVDPWVTTFTAAEGVKFIDRVEAAYDRVVDAYMVVYTEFFSAHDRDLRRLHLDAVSGQPLSPPGYLDLTGVSVTVPSIAHVASPNMFMVAANEGHSSGTRTRVIGRRISGSGATVGGWQTLVDSPFNLGEFYEPKLGGDSGDFGSPQFGLVTRERNGSLVDVEFRRISPTTGLPIPYSKRSVLQGLHATIRAVAISSTTGDPYGEREWVIAILDNNYLGNYMQVSTARIGHNGLTVHPASVVSSSASVGWVRDLTVSALGSKRSPSTGEPYYLVTYIETGTPWSDRMVLCSGGVGHEARSAQGLLHMPEWFDGGFIVTGATSQGWAITHGSFLGSLPKHGAYITTLSAQHDRLAAIDRRRTLSDGQALRVGMATTFEGGNTSYSDALSLWSTNEPGTILGSITFDLDDEAAGAQYCFGAPNSTLEYGFIQATGDVSRFTSKEFQASGLPPSDVGYFMASQGQGFVPAAWGGSGTLCLVSPRYLSGSIQNVSSAGTMDFTLLPNQLPWPWGQGFAFPGSSWHFQAVHIDAGHANFTNAMTIRYD